MKDTTFQNKLKSYSIWLINSFFIIFFIYLLINLATKEWLILYWDASTILNPDVYLERTLQTFSNFRFPWIINPQIHWHLIYALIFKGISYFSSDTIVIQKIFYTLLLSSGFFSIKYFITKEMESKNIILWNLICLFYLFGSLTILSYLRIFNLWIFFYLFIPIFLVFSLEFINWRKSYLLAIYLSVVIMSPWFSNIAYLPILFLLLTIYIYIKKSRFELITFLRLWLIFLISIFAISFILIPQVLLVNSFIWESLYWWIFSAYLSNMINWWIINTLTLSFLNYSITSNYFSFFWVLIVILFIFFCIREGDFIKNNKKILILFCLIILLFAWPYSNIIYNIYDYIFNNVPYIWMYRDMHQKFLVIYMIVLIIIITKIIDFQWKIKNNTKNYVLSIFLILHIILWLSLFIGNTKNIKINNDDYKLFEYLNTNNDYTVLSLPISEKPLSFFYFNSQTYSSFDLVQLATNNINISNLYWSSIIDANYENINAANYSDIMKYNIKYILINKNPIFFKDDQIEDFNNLILKLENIYLKVIENNNFIIFDTQLAFSNTITWTSKYEVVNNSKYILNNVSLDKEKIIHNRLFHPEWKIYLKDEVSLFSKPLFDSTHTKIYDYANQWTIDSKTIKEYVETNYWDELLKQWYPKVLSDWRTDYKYYIENSDGSIDVELTLYFKPQIYFYIGLIISGTTFLLLVLWLIIASIPKRRKNK